MSKGDGGYCDNGQSEVGKILAFGAILCGGICVVLLLNAWRLGGY